MLVLFRALSLKVGVVYIKSHRGFQPPVSTVKVYMVSVCLLELGCKLPWQH